MMSEQELRSEIKKNKDLIKDVGSVSIFLIKSLGFIIQVYLDVLYGGSQNQWSAKLAESKDLYLVMDKALADYKATSGDQSYPENYFSSVGALSCGYEAQ